MNRRGAETQRGRERGERAMVDARIKILIADDPQHERCFAEIYVDDRFLAIVSDENPESGPTIELPGIGLDEERVTRSVPLAVFQRGVELALKRLYPERIP